MKLFLKNFLFFILYYFFPKIGENASILAYHSIGDNKAFFTVSEKNFENQLKYLKDKRFKVVKLSELVKKMKEDVDISGMVCITFDDGYKDNYDIVFPLLKKYNFPATFFLTTNFIEKQMTNSQNIIFNMMTKENIREMELSGLAEFMPHTHNHFILDKIDFNKAKKDIEASMNEIKAITEFNAYILAYPKGFFTEEIINYLKNNNWLGAVTMRSGLVKNSDDLYRLKRNSVDSSTSFIQFKCKLSEAIDKYNTIKNE